MQTTAVRQARIAPEEAWFKMPSRPMTMNMPGWLKKAEILKTVAEGRGMDGALNFQGYATRRSFGWSNRIVWTRETNKKSAPCGGSFFRFSAALTPAV
jgi:hypothetical protein